MPNVPPPASVLATLGARGIDFVEDAGHTRLHQVLRANAAAGIVSAAAAVDTNAKLELFNQVVGSVQAQVAQALADNKDLAAKVTDLEGQVATLEGQVTQATSDNAVLAKQLAALQGQVDGVGIRTGALETRSETLDRAIDRLRARQHEFGHAVKHAEMYLVAWQGQHAGDGPALALGLASASLFWLMHAPRILEHAEFAGETLAQRIQKINGQTTYWKALVDYAVEAAGRDDLQELAPDLGAREGDILETSSEDDAREEIGRRAGLAMWLFAVVALIEPARAAKPSPRSAASRKSKAPGDIE